MWNSPIVWLLDVIALQHFFNDHSAHFDQATPYNLMTNTFLKPAFTYISTIYPTISVQRVSFGFFRIHDDYITKVL